MPAAELLVLDRITKLYRGGLGVAGISLCVGRGAIVSIVGGNGAGKTTVLSLIAGTVAADSGRVIFRDRDVTSLGALARSEIGILRVANEVLVFAGLSCRENIALGFREQIGEKVSQVLFRPHSAIRADSSFRERAIALLRENRLIDQENSLAGTLSLGQQKRLALTRITASAPHLILLDEPFAGLDETAATECAHTLVDLRRQGASVVLAGHEIERAFAISDYAYWLEDGAIRGQCEARDFGGFAKSISR